MVKDKKVPALTGIRGVAAVSVLAFHNILPFVSDPSSLVAIKSVLCGFWIGVDSFFVLSGFLITSIILRAKDSHRFFFVFYMKRAFRILPPYLALLIWGTAYWYFSSKSASLSEIFSKTAHFWYLFQNTHVANFWSSSEVDKFYVSLIGHSWSLAIEEQFYFIWPLVVYFNPVPRLKKIAVTGLVAVTLWRTYQSVIYYKLVSTSMLGTAFVIQHFEIYFSTFTRADLLLMGSLLALMYDENEQSVYFKLNPLMWIILGVCAFTSSSLIFNPYLPLASSIAHSVGFSIIGLFFFFLIGHLTTNFSSRISAIFSNRISVRLGRVSYSFYLFHHPITVLFYKHALEKNGWISGFSPALQLLMGFTTTLLISYFAAELSWLIIESPALRLRERLGYT